MIFPPPSSECWVHSTDKPKARPGGYEGKKGERMKRGIEMSWACDHKDRPHLRIEKKRGKLTLEEIQDLLMYEESQRYCGHYAILLNCSESAVDGGSLYLEEEQKGDTVALYQIEEGEICPVCGGYTPPFVYCPNCGTAWKDMDKDVEKLIAAMRAEAERSIKSENPNQTRDGRLAWYWSYIGALDMAQQLGMVTDERRQELYEDAKRMKELAKEKR